jgi:uncharacterized protein with von Willebrand factor type A (vWA) domain
MPAARSSISTRKRERLAEAADGHLSGSAAWLNPTPEAYWGHSASTAILKRLMNERMYPLTLDGLDDAMRDLGRKG